MFKNLEGSHPVVVGLQHPSCYACSALSSCCGRLLSLRALGMLGSSLRDSIGSFSDALSGAAGFTPPGALRKCSECVGYCPCRPVGSQVAVREQGL